MPLLKNLSFVSRPSPKKVFLSKDELSRIKEIHFGEDFVIIRKGNSYLALSRNCPHLGCKLNYDPEKEWIVCPCHQSKFTLTGKYIEGPAKKDLRPLPFELNERGLFLEIS